MSTGKAQPVVLAGLVRRQGEIVTVDTVGPPAIVTVDIGDSGVGIPGVRCVYGYTPTAGDIVNVDDSGGVLLVIG